MFVDCEESPRIRDESSIVELLRSNTHVTSKTYPAGRVDEIRVALHDCPQNLTPMLSADGNTIHWTNNYMMGFMSLDEWLTENRNPPSDVVIRLIFQILRGYSAVHAVSHGNIYLGNIFVDQQRSVELGPLGQQADSVAEIRTLAYMLMDLVARTHCGSRILRGIIVHMLIHPGRFDFNAVLSHELFERIGAPEQLRSASAEITQLCDILDEKFATFQDATPLEEPDMSKRDKSIVSRAFQFISSKFGSYSYSR